jgi:hypothetical protein
MDIQVLVEQVNESLYRASALTLSAEGATVEKAVAELEPHLKKLVLDQVVAGARFVTMPVPIHPSLWHLSKRKLDDPLVQEYLNILAENRRKADAEESLV